MKSLTTIGMLILLFSFGTTFGQHADQRPALFANYPISISCSAADIAALFHAQVGQQVNARMGNVLPIAGTVTQKEQRYANLRLMAVKLPAFNNLLMSISERLDENNRPVYMAHLIDNKYRDGYQLKRLADGNYQFVKLEMGRILNDCADH